MWIRPISLSLLLFISLIGNLSTLCEIKAENQCLVSNHFQTNLFHLFSPFPPPSFSRSFSLPPPNANRGSRVMTSLLLLSCTNNALKIERERGMWQIEEKGCWKKKWTRNGYTDKNPLNELGSWFVLWCRCLCANQTNIPTLCLPVVWRVEGKKGKWVTGSFKCVKIYVLFTKFRWLDYETNWEDTCYISVQ